MDENNYTLLLDKLKEFENRLTAQDAQLKEMIDFNKSLLNSKQVVETTKEDKTMQYQERLDKGLKTNGK